MIAIALLLSVALGYWPSLISLLQLWLDASQGYGHGIWTSLLAGYFGWQRARFIRWNPPRLTVVLLTTISALWTLSYLTHNQVLHQSFFALQVVLLIWIMLGTVNLDQSIKQLLLPAILWLMGIPVWSVLLVPVLQKISIVVTSTWMHILNLPAWIVGEKIQLPFGALVIAGGCSGLRYLLVAVALSCGYALLNRLSLRHSCLLIGVAAICAIFMNWVRIAVLVNIAYHSQMQHPWVQDHNLLGWLLFAIVMLPVIFLGRQLPSTSPAEFLSPQLLSPPAHLLFKQTYHLPIALLLLPLMGYALMLNSFRITPRNPKLPTIIDGAFVTPSQHPWQLQMINADGHDSATYHPMNGSVIEARIAWYHHQTQAHELDYGENVWLPNWPVLDHDDNHAKLQGTNGEYQASWCYVVAGHNTTRLRQAKWVAVKQLFNLRNPRQDAVMVVVLQKQLLQAQPDNTSSNTSLPIFATRLCAALAESESPVFLPAVD